MTPEKTYEDFMESSDDTTVSGGDEDDSFDERLENLSSLSNVHAETIIRVCGTCQAEIHSSINDWDELHAVKCKVCEEWTPIGKPPRGKMYVRCFCKRLLIAGQRIDRIACTKCRRITEIPPTPSPSSLAPMQMVLPGQALDNSNPKEGFDEKDEKSYVCNKRKRQGLTMDEFYYDFSELKENTAKYQATGGLPTDLPDDDVPKGSEMEVDDLCDESWD